MTTPSNPFPLPAEMPAPLAQAHAYWDGLRRGDNNMPFWDDVKLSALSDIEDGLLLMDAFIRPQRFRFNVIGQSYLQDNSPDLVGTFADEADLEDRMGFLQSQLSAAVEANGPTFYRHDGAGAFSRLLLPMWGDGHVGMILGALHVE